jgi:hypothetical protein
MSELYTRNFGTTVYFKSFRLTLPYKTLNSDSRILLEKLTHSASQENPTLYGTQRFITIFTIAHYWPLT